MRPVLALAAEDQGDRVLQIVEQLIFSQKICLTQVEIPVFLSAVCLWPPQAGGRGDRVAASAAAPVVVAVVVAAAAAGLVLRKILRNKRGLNLQCFPPF